MKAIFCKAFLISIACAGWTGCVNVEDSIFHTQYEKTNWYNAGGYDDRMIQSDLYQVWFASNQLVTKENVDYFALVRAAEVTVLAGREYFEVISGEDVGKTIRYSSPGTVISSTTGVANTSVTGRGTATVVGNTAYGSIAGTANTVAGSTTTTVYRPPSETSVTYPKTLLTIRLVNEKTESAYNAKELLLGAKQRKLKLQVKVE